MGLLYPFNSTWNSSKWHFSAKFLRNSVDFDLVGQSLSHGVNTGGVVHILNTSPNSLNVSITMFSLKLKVLVYTPVFAVIHADEKDR